VLRTTVERMTGLSTGLAMMAASFLPLGCSSSTGPGGGTPDPITELPRSLSQQEEQVIAESRSFGFSLLRETDSRRESSMANTVLSPLSASMSLGMALVGANGETFSAMQSAMGFGGLTREEVFASYEGLMDLLLELDPAVEIQVANSAWSREDFPFRQDYFDNVTRYFEAMIRALDFGDPASRDTINGWVEENTGGHIREIVQEIRREDILFLINALYFKGDWTTQFKEGDTRPLPFRLPDGSTVDVPTMTGSIPFAGVRFLENGRVVGELPYGGQAFGLVLVVPGADETVDDLLAVLDEDTWTAWTASLGSQTVSVQMPRLEVEWGGLLNDPLKAMGMEVAFDPNLADFSHLSPVSGIYISRVRQKTFMKIDEEGTTAAAATSTGMSVTSAPASLVVDRPFLLAIRERLSGTVLFLGAIRDPR